jgi:HPt (histidine-containing phosphotransfer) domain-containing protein
MNDERDKTDPAYSPQEQARAATTQGQTTKPSEQAEAPGSFSDHARRAADKDLAAKRDDPETRTRINGSGSDSSPGKKARREKPTFREFIDLAKQAISATPSRVGLRSLQKLLKGGVSAKSPLTPLVDELFALLRDWPECSRLALQLSVQTRTKRSSELIRSLRDRLIAHSRSVVGYPEAMRSAVADYDQLTTALTAWVRRQASNDAGTRNDKTADVVDLGWVRWAAVCLMEERLGVSTEGIYRLLEALCPRYPAFAAQEAESLFFSELGDLLGTDKTSSRKVAAGLRLAGGARSLGAEAHGQLRAARDTIGRQNARLDELEATVRALTDSLANATAQIADLSGRLLQKTQEVEHEKKERHLDKEHWDSLGEQQLTRKLNEISERLVHEISEAKLCLSDDAPNVRMALDRMRQMEKALAKVRDGPIRA